MSQSRKEPELEKLRKKKKERERFLKDSERFETWNVSERFRKIRRVSERENIFWKIRNDLEIVL